MSGQDTRPTPVSGMPAVVAANPDAQPNGDEIAAPRSTNASAILEALDGIRAEVQQTRDEARERDKAHEARFTRLESQIADVAGKTDGNTKLIGEQAEAITRVASAAAKAADLALEAKQATSRAPAEMQQLVESALRIHGAAAAASIAATVDESVQRAIQPLAQKVGQIEQREEERDKQIALSNEALGAVVDELGIEDRVELGRKAVPGEKKQERALKKLDTRAKHSTVVQFVIAVGVIVNALYQLLSSGHH